MPKKSSKPNVDCPGVYPYNSQGSKKHREKFALRLELIGAISDLFFGALLKGILFYV